MGEISPAPNNLLNRDFSAGAPNEKWLTDITEFQIPDGKVYLSPMIDCFDGMVERAIRTLKEQYVHRHRFETLQHASRVIGDWIGFHNHRRPHQALGMKAPAKAYALVA